MKIMKTGAPCLIALILPATVAMLADAQSSTENRGRCQETQICGYWVDPSTGLMWPVKDNGKAVTWHTAMKYCRNLRLAGYSDWRQPTLDELATLVDKVSSTPERVGGAETMDIGPHVKGNLSLTGDAWSANREINRFGKPYGPGWFFNFTTSKPSYDLQLFRNTKYALCVRRAEK
ncbi:MAG TPA: DUF1566 domain-containing protein [Acidobacteriaceae bacterium]|jgi:hypothetical protein|nr:DUF1566 domain-containing protein [Acidobacteriaceae bacterium]